MSEKLSMRKLLEVESEVSFQCTTKTTIITSSAIETHLSNSEKGPLPHGMFWLLRIDFVVVMYIIGPVKSMT